MTFIKGSSPWNKGKRYKLIRPKQWSLRYHECKGCGSIRKFGRNKHYSKGFCGVCYYLKRKKIDEKKVKIRSARYWKKIKANPILLEERRKYANAWGKNSPTARFIQKKYRRKKAMRKLVRQWLTTQKIAQGYQRGPEMIIEYGKEEYQIPVLYKKKTQITEAYMILYREAIIFYLEEKLSTGLDNQALDKDGWHRV